MIKDANSPGLPDGRIRATLYAEPVGADGVFDLAALSLNIHQGNSFNKIPVYAGISCGTPSLQFDDEYLHLNTWQVLMRLNLENARIVEGSIRKDVVQKGSFQSSAEETTELRTVKQHKRKLGYGIDGKVGQSSASFGMRFGAGGDHDVDHSEKTNVAAKTNRVREIVLIGPYGKNTIAFGDPDYGDALRELGFLAFEYPETTAGGSEPLFYLEPIDPTKSVCATVFTAVPFDRLHISMERRSSLLRKVVEDDLGQRGRDAVELLRAQFFASELAEQVQKNQNEAGNLVSAREGEFVVAIEQVIISPQLPEIGRP